ncbi:MAG: ferritin family protein [Gudongella sp.]|jgi:rubrerythrin|nr:ferritin family protein [Gudongella sp.]
MDNIKFAIQMELDGEKFYNEQAEKNKGNKLEEVFRFLAKDEHKHAELVKTFADAGGYVLDEGNALNEFNNIFTDEKDFSLKTTTDPRQIDAYRLALRKEKESIDLYKKMREESETDEGKKLFDYLVRQEEYHYSIFDNLEEHLRKAEDWVEDAEFGKRPKY